MIDFEFLLAAGIKTNRLIFLMPYMGTQKMIKIHFRTLSWHTLVLSLLALYGEKGFFLFNFMIDFRFRILRRLAGRPHFYTISPYGRNGGGSPKYGIIV